jgi:hypothetical protein
MNFKTDFTTISSPTLYKLLYTDVCKMYIIVAINITCNPTEVWICGEPNKMGITCLTIFSDIDI